jgi:hypothetical protein
LISRGRKHGLQGTKEGYIRLDAFKSGIHTNKKALLDRSWVLPDIEKVKYSEKQNVASLRHEVKKLGLTLRRNGARTKKYND